jgi:hypothetical protein
VVDIEEEEDWLQLLEGLTDMVRSVSVQGSLVEVE